MGRGSSYKWSEITPINGLVSGFHWGDISPLVPWRCHFTRPLKLVFGSTEPKNPRKVRLAPPSFFGGRFVVWWLEDQIQHIKSKTCTKKKLKNTDQATKIWYLITSFYGLPEALGKMDLQPQSGVNGCISP